jgi:hypothetical protein
MSISSTLIQVRGVGSGGRCQAKDSDESGMDEVDGVVDGQDTPKTGKGSGRPRRTDSTDSAAGRKRPTIWKWKVPPVDVEGTPSAVVGQALTDADRAQQEKVASDTQRQKKKLDKRQVSFISETYSFLGIRLSNRTIRMIEVFNAFFIFSNLPFVSFHVHYLCDKLIINLFKNRVTLASTYLQKNKK